MAKSAAPSQEVLGQLLELRNLVSQSDSIELKVTVPDHTNRSATTALGIDPLEAQVRQVYFFDTPDLRLNQAGVVVRARRVQGRPSDTTVKLRPVVPDQLRPEFRKSPNLVIEVDAMRGSYVCSASMKSTLAPKVVRSTILEGKPIRKLFSKEQRAFYAAHAPEGIELDDLTVLGPIFVLKVTTYPDRFDRKLVGELWTYPDGTRIVELSAKCLPGQGVDLLVDMLELFESRNIDISGEQHTKTKTALEFFANELQTTS